MRDVGLQSRFTSVPLTGDTETVSALAFRPPSVGTVQFSRPLDARGVTSRPAGAYADDTHRKLIPFPSGTIITPGPTFERGEFSQTLIDVTAVFFGFLFVLCSALGIVASVFVLFFGGF